MIIADQDIDPEGLAACARMVEQQTLGSVRYFKQTDSTNLQAMTDLNAPEAVTHAPRLHLADSQTAGRGRQGRVWLADDGTLTFTLTLVDQRFASTATGRPTACLPLPLVVGLALVRTIDQLTDGVVAKLKWPNDVYVDDRKLAAC